MCILWLAIAIALVVGLIKTSVRLLKFIFTVCFIGAAWLFLSSLGLFLW